ncbi:MAG TPA: nucleotidyltransferase family protein [Gallionella sp.]|nr:nucleotidyltransferase family protein [Gallionella sp.]
MPDPVDIAAIVLAAGTSRRFGTNKLLHPVVRHGLTLPLAAHSLLPWLDTFPQVSVVVRPSSEMFRSTIEMSLGAARSARIRWVACADAAQGMSASLACGVHANRDAAGWLVGLADMPAVPVAAITSVRTALEGGTKLAAPFCKGRRGHPVGFGAHYYGDLLGLQGDAGARSLLERDGSRVARIEIGSDGIIADIDTLEDLRRL